MFKNVSGQKITVFAFDQTTGAGKTGLTDITLYVNKDGGGANATSNACSEVDATKDAGGYIVTLTQAETNADYIRISGKSATSNIQVVAQNIYTVPPNFTTLAIDSSGNVPIIPGNRPGIRKNVALPNFGIFLTDSTNHAPATGKTGLALTRSIDGGAFAAGSLSAATEISGGWYKFDWNASDLNGDIILLRVTCAGCDDLNIEIRTAP